MRLRSLTEEEHRTLIRVARRKAPASMWIKGAAVLNVYTKEWQHVHVAVAGERIAYVGEQEPLVDADTDIFEAEGYFLVPGYIEPHAHPFQWYNPFTFADFALSRGTTTLIADTMMLMQLPAIEQVGAFMESLTEHPVKHLFWARFDPQTGKKNPYFTREGLASMLEHRLVIQGGELTHWQGVLQEEGSILFGLKYAADIGKRIEGHHPGASFGTLNTAAAAGVTACHEGIHAQDLLNRLRLGMYATLRHSSIRPDLPKLVKGWLELGLPWSSRMMLTSDGSTPPMYKNGLMDYTVRVAIEAGMPPEEAYLMATLNPAVYYGLDSEVGGIAPGRLADMLLLRAKDQPTPEWVIANGQRAANKKELLVDTIQPQWQAYGFPAADRLDVRTKESWFSLTPESGLTPVLHLENAVITRLQFESLPVTEKGNVSLEHDPALAYIAVIDPDNRRVTKAVLANFAEDVDGLASTYTASGDWVVIGRNPRDMAAALEQVRNIGGGVVLMDNGSPVLECHLPISGIFSLKPMNEVIAMAEELMHRLREKGYVHLDPMYSLLFVTSTHLPYARLTTDGIVDVIKGEVVVPASPLE
jgi:adenine deaminase